MIANLLKKKQKKQKPYKVNISLTLLHRPGNYTHNSKKFFYGKKASTINLNDSVAQ